MNRVVACAVVLASMPVLAGPVRKPPTDKYPADALHAFVDAVLADKRGDLDVAMRRYLDADRASPQAHTFYNLADIYRRMERPDRAVEALAKYLELAPDAPDRAQVEKLIARLSREATLVVDGDDFDGVILVDGKLAGPSPAVLALPSGSYLTDRISPTSFESRTVTLRAPRAEHVRLSTSNRQTGNLVLAGNRGGLIMAWDQDGASLRIPGRAQLSPGRHTLTPRGACSPIVVDVPREPAAVAYVFVAVKPTETGCVPIVAKVQICGRSERELARARGARGAVVLGVLAASAEARPQRKKASDKFSQAAGEAFAAAVAADTKGDLLAALGLYQKAFGISPHPSTAYNIADVERRLARWDDALKSYELYLALSPAAADRAEVEAVIEKLVTTPARLFVVTTGAKDPNSIDLARAYILVDGVIVIRPGTAPEARPEIGGQLAIALEVGPGSRVVDVVTPITFGSQICTVKPGDRRHCSVTAKPRIDGRVVISALDRGLVVKAARDGKTLVATRTELTPGRHRLLVRDRSFECSPLTIDAPSGGDVGYVFAWSGDYDGVPRCRKLDYTHHRLRFAP